VIKKQSDVCNQALSLVFTFPQSVIGVNIIRPLASESQLEFLLAIFSSPLGCVPKADKDVPLLDRLKFCQFATLFTVLNGDCLHQINKQKGNSTQPDVWMNDCGLDVEPELASDKR
jgi:hypothetical protein